MAFHDATLAFLRSLQHHNDRDWFLAHRGEYEQDVRRPCLAFADEVAAPLRRMGADVPDAASCLAPQHRDRRFAADVPPYWTHVLLRFPMLGTLPPRWAPAFALRIAADGAVLTAGVRDLGADLMMRVRRRIVEEDLWWARLRGRLPALQGRQVNGVPRGFDPAHRHAQDLRRKEILCSVPFTAREVTDAAFATRFVQACRTLGPLNRFLVEALETP